MPAAVICPACKLDSARRSHRRGSLERLASLLAFYPYRCPKCSRRFLRFRYAPAILPAAARAPVEREIKATRRAIEWKRKRREFLFYGLGLLMFLAFLYFITRERAGPSDG